MKSPIIDRKKVLKSFRYAVVGLFSLFREENNARVHLVASVITIVGAYLLQFSLIEWAILLLTISMVLVAEAFNTALERLANRVSTEYHVLIKEAKDISAAAVLLAAIGACVIGVVLFTPKLLQLL